MPLNAGSQGKGAATGDLAIAALDPTHLASERQVTVTDCPEFWNAAPGPCGDLLSPRNETPAQPEYSFTKQRELCIGAGLATREGRGYQDLVTHLRNISWPWFTMLLGILTNE